MAMRKSRGHGTVGRWPSGRLCCMMNCLACSSGLGATPRRLTGAQRDLGVRRAARHPRRDRLLRRGQEWGRDNNDPACPLACRDGRRDTAGRRRAHRHPSPRRAHAGPWPRCSRPRPRDQMVNVGDDGVVLVKFVNTNRVQTKAADLEGETGGGLGLRPKSSTWKVWARPRRGTELTQQAIAVVARSPAAVRWPGYPVRTSRME